MNVAKRSNTSRINTVHSVQKNPTGQPCFGTERLDDANVQPRLKGGNDMRKCLREVMVLAEARPRGQNQHPLGPMLLMP